MFISKLKDVLFSLVFELNIFFSVLSFYFFIYKTFTTKFLQNTLNPVTEILLELLIAEFHT